MASDSTQPEPTMEEILASIRRIISEDDEEQPSDGEEVLDLEETDEPEAVASEDEMDMAAAMAAEADDGGIDILDEASDEPDPFLADPAPAPIDVEDEIIVDEEDDWGAAMEEQAEEEPAPAMSFEPAPEPEPDIVVSPPQDEPLDFIDEEPAPTEAPNLDYSGEGLVADQTAFAAAGAFSKLMGDLVMSNGMTVDELVRAMLKPLLKEWLDANLPTLVEREVQKELRRISRMSGK